MAKEKQSFEVAAGELEEIVNKLEKGELTLDESIVLFQRGIELSRYCSKRLDEVEKKITMLIEEENGEVKEVPFKLGTSLEEKNEP